MNIPDKTWINPKVDIVNSAIGGKGMIAKEPINKGEKVVIWGGEYTNKQGAKEAEHNGYLVMQWDDNLFSVETPGDEEGYFINHSCTPNIWMDNAITLTALRDVERGEEIVADYAMWEADDYFVSKWKCNCGSVNCRNKVTGKDWQMKELQKRYKGHFSPLINKRIEKLKNQ